MLQAIAMINLEKCKLLGSDGIEREAINGIYTEESLSNIFIENWIPYMECHKCGRSDYCKYAVSNPFYEHKKKEIRCGVAQTAIRNFVASTFNMAKDLDLEGKQAYLDGAYYFTRFIREAEQQIGTVINKDYLEWYGIDSPIVFGFMIRIRDTLNSMSENFQKIPNLRSTRGVLLVEGLSEVAFINNLKKTRLAWFSNLIVECYEGSGNSNPKRITMLLEKYKKIGYSIYIQGDADGKSQQIFKRLVDLGTIKEENSFVFIHDFETSVPIHLFFKAMQVVGFPTPFCQEQLIQSTSNNNRTIIRILLEEFGVDISGRKIELAEAIGEILNDPEFIWWQDVQFMGNELGKFIQFIQKVE